MKRVLLALVAIAFVSCATTTPPASPAAAAQCNPAMPMLNSVLWMQTAAEYRASALGTYAAARRSLDTALSDPAWVGAAEETTNDPSQPPAIILDLDETAIDNGEFESRVFRIGKTMDTKMWDEWVAGASARPIPGAAEFLAYAKSRGVTPFYITNRDDPEEAAGTLENVRKLGYPLDQNVDTLLMRGEREFKSSDKGPRRQWVADRYRVLLVLGDDLNDFADAREKSREERDAIIARTQSWWGTRWFMLPNSMYGSWERAITGNAKTDCERVQRKIDALR